MVKLHECMALVSSQCIDDAQRWTTCMSLVGKMIAWVSHTVSFECCV